MQLYKKYDTHEPLVAFYSQMREMGVTGCVGKCLQSLVGPGFLHWQAVKQS